MNPIPTRLAPDCLIRSSTPSFGEGVYGGAQCVLNGFGRFLFGKYNGEVHEIAGHDGGGNAAGFYGHDFIDIGGGEAANKFYSDGFH